MLSPTPETGTPESSRSPIRTPAEQLRPEELIVLFESSRGSPAQLSPNGARIGPAAARLRYPLLHSTAKRHPLYGIVLPDENELRSAAVAGLPLMGRPPILPHHLSPSLQAVLQGWRSVYEQCTQLPVLQAVVASTYAPEAVFEDSTVSARGHEAVYRQFAMLGMLLRAAQVGVYSVACSQLSAPRVQLDLAAAEQQRQQLAAAAAAAAEAQGLGPARRAGPAGVPSRVQGAGGLVPLHLTRIEVENVQSYSFALPGLLAWLLGAKSGALQVPLYVTSVILVASDVPLVLPSREDPGAIESRLAGAAAALGRGAAPPRALAGALPYHDGSGPSGSGLGEGGRGPEGPSLPRWLVVHHTDTWHNVPLVWWALRRLVARVLDATVGRLLGV